MACYYVGQVVTGGVVSATAVPGVVLTSDDSILSSQAACQLSERAASVSAEVQGVVVAVAAVLISVSLLFAGWRLANRVIRGAASAG